MKVYLKNGEIVTVSQEEGIIVINTILKGDGNNVVVLTNNKKPYAYFVITEIVAIK